MSTTSRTTRSDSSDEAQSSSSLSYSSTPQTPHNGWLVEDTSALMSLNDLTCQELARAHHDKKEIDGCSLVVVLQTLTMLAIIRRWQLRLPTNARVASTLLYSGETQR